MNKDFLLIQKYYLFQLSEEELLQFETRMQQDEAFAALVIKYHQNQQTASEYYSSEEEILRKEKWEHMLSELPSSEKKEVKLFSFARLAAASIILLIGIGSLFYLFSENDTERWETVLAEAQNLSPEVELNLLRGETEKSQQLLSDAYAFYLAEDYKSALQLFNKVSENEKNYEEALLLEAISHYRLGEYERSLVLLNRFDLAISKEQEGPVLWYKSLNYLGKRELEKAKATLKELSTTDLEISNSAKLVEQLINQFQSE